jgi:hypothetical protein
MSHRSARPHRRLRDGDRCYRRAHEGAGRRCGSRMSDRGGRTPVGHHARLAGCGRAEPLPAETEARIAKFTELVATAISNVQRDRTLRSPGRGSWRPPMTSAGGLVRDLHDGAQQRLVNAIVTLKLAREALAQGQESATGLVGEALDHTEQAIAELRELSHGILPTILTRGGLRAAIEALASHRGGQPAAPGPRRRRRRRPARRQRARRPSGSARRTRR